MMGHSHAVTGAAGWLALTCPPPFGFGLLDLSTEHVLSGILIAGGAALLPDTDHHSGTASYVLPPISGMLTRFIGTISGGHRHGTHSFIGAAAFTAIAVLASLWRTDLRYYAPWLPDGFSTFQIGNWLLICYLVVMGAKALRIAPGWQGAWIIALGLGTFLTYAAPTSMWWLPLAVGIGCLIHMLGDALTTQGIPPLWPLVPLPPVETAFWRRNGYMAIPALGNAGSIREHILICLVSAYCAASILETLSPGSLSSALTTIGG